MNPFGDIRQTYHLATPAHYVQPFYMDLLKAKVYFINHPYARSKTTQHRHRYLSWISKGGYSRSLERRAKSMGWVLTGLLYSACYHTCYHQWPTRKLFLLVIRLNERLDDLIMCRDYMSYIYLMSSGNIVYMWHRQFLPQKHRYRLMAKYFDKTEENEVAPETRSGSVMFKMTKNIKVVFWKGDEEDCKEEHLCSGGPPNRMRRSILLTRLPIKIPQYYCLNSLPPNINRKI